MKRVFCLLLALILILPTTACGVDSPSAPAVTSTTAPAPDKNIDQLITKGDVALQDRRFDDAFKFFTEAGGLESADIKQILAYAEGSDTTGFGGGSLQKGEFMDTYAKILADKIRAATGEEKPLEGFKIVVDAGNGAGGFYADKVLKPLGANTEGSRYLDPDGSFPNHIPNPEDKEAMESITEAVRETGADLGIIFDTDVDRAERESALCRRLNLDATVCLAEAAEQIGASFLFLSSDYVFSGEGEEFYRTSSPKLPLSVYGLSKSLAEDAVLSLCSRAKIIRTSWLFGRQGKNFVYTLLSRAERQEEIPVVCDQIGSPTYTKDLAAALLGMIGTERYGVYHVTNEGVCSRAEFAAEILRLAGGSARILPVESSALPTAARRPHNSRLSKDCLTENGFPRLPHWKDALARFLRETGAIGETNTEGGAPP